MSSDTFPWYERSAMSRSNFFVAGSTETEKVTVSPRRFNRLAIDDFVAGCCCRCQQLLIGCVANIADYLPMSFACNGSAPKGQSMERPAHVIALEDHQPELRDERAHRERHQHDERRTEQREDGLAKVALHTAEGRAPHRGRSLDVARRRAERTRAMSYVRHFRHTSAVLEHNPMGDPFVRNVPVYLPPDYSERRREPYPVVFLLAGWSGRGAHYLADGGAFSFTLTDRLDQLITDGTLPACIVVFPDCATRLGASQYVNSPANGNYMDYVTDELVDYIDGRFHTHKSRDYRGVIGHSSGGFGALAFGMMRSDRFGAVCSSAGDSWYEFMYRNVIPPTISAVNAAGGVEKFVESFLANPNPFALMGSTAVVAMLTLSMASCYTPNVEVPVIKGDLWFDLETGELVDDAWRRLCAWDPIAMVDRYVTELRSLRWIHLEAGLDDEYGLQFGHRQIAKKLAAHGISYALDEYPGKHGGHHHRMPERLRRMTTRMLAK
ncbi:MAG: hypothetical protein EXR75_01595 [Myxococcales bacterium]|nr:hypothetical protein [Myxococcales bacterium]